MSKRAPTQSANPPPTLGRHGRAVGLDIHPDSFAAAILQGRDPLQARVLHSVTRQPLAALSAWAARHTTAQDVLILEATANSFAVAERLAALGRQVFILESHRAGQIGKSYLANDRLDAAKIARIYLSGLAIEVWQPDPETRQRRELLKAGDLAAAERTAHTVRCSRNGVHPPPAFDCVRLAFVGRRSGRRYSIGAELSVIVACADAYKRQIDFAPVGETKPACTGSPTAAPRSHGRRSGRILRAVAQTVVAASEQGRRRRR